MAIQIWVLTALTEALDVQMLLEPLEEQFHLPAAFGQPRDGQRRPGEVVAQIGGETLGFLVEESDVPQASGISLSAERDCQLDELVGTPARVLFDRHGMHPRVVRRTLCSNHEEGPKLVEGVEAEKIQIPAVHHAEGAGFDRHLVQRMDVVEFPVADMDEHRNGAAQIQQRMQFDGALGAPEAGPAERAQSRSWWNPGRRPSRPDPSPAARSHTAGVPARSTAGPAWRRCASRGVRWRKLRCCAESRREIQGNRAVPAGHTVSPRCRADSPSRPVGRRPCKGTGSST